MDRGGLAVAAGAAAHLVELDGAERHVVEHDVADVWQVDALAERARGDDARERAGAERLLHAVALLAREAGIVERNALAQLGVCLPQRAGKHDGLLARVHVAHALLARARDRDERGLAVMQLALVVEHEVGAARVVHDDVVDAGKLADLPGNGSAAVAVTASVTGCPSSPSTRGSSR